MAIGIGSSYREDGPDTYYNSSNYTLAVSIDSSNYTSLTSNRIINEYKPLLYEN